MIKAEKLTKLFDDIPALNAVSCTIPDGSVYGLVGSNGAGKSTFLRLATGVYKANSGSITIDNEPVYENPAVKQRIAYIADEPYFLQGADLNRMANLYAAAFPAFDNQRFGELAATFRLDSKKSLGNFSKGMKRQAAIVLALSCRAAYYLFDETLDGLDPIMRNIVKCVICEEVLEHRTTVIITSHSLRELEDTCDQLALLHQGGLVLESDVQNLKTSLFKVQIAFSHEYTKDLFNGMDILQFTKSGSVSNFIVRGNRDETVSRLKEMQPVVLDILPLSLEEIFTYEMGTLGYAFKDEQNA